MELENLTRAEFEKHLQDKTLRIAFLGMSNSGKSYRAKILTKELDFFWYQVDEEIQKELGFKDMEEISNWLGFPDSQNYSAKEKKYLELENKYTIVDDQKVGNKNLVFDATGSVIYLNNQVKKWLREECLLINIDVGENAVEQMMEKFFLEPKPLIWNNIFNPQPNESRAETLKRCYPELLKSRLNNYRKMAHINIPAEEIWDLSGEETLNLIKKYLN